MAKKTRNDDYDIFCSFCGRYKDEVGKLIAGPNGIFICEDCIDICNKIILEDLIEEEDLENILMEEENAGKKKNTKEVDLVAKLFDEIAPKYADRKGGYTRIVKIGLRKGDAAMEVVLELV